MDRRFGFSGVGALIDELVWVEFQRKKKPRDKPSQIPSGGHASTLFVIFACQRSQSIYTISFLLHYLACLSFFPQNYSLGELRIDSEKEKIWGSL